jgi:hypothetical protein
MARTPIDLADLLDLVGDRQSTEHLIEYFEPGRQAGTMPRYSGSRFEFFAGGGDRPDVADVITAEDLVAVTMLSVHVPGDVALQLLEGDLGPSISRHLAHVPRDASISDPAAAELFAPSSHARVAWDLLEKPHGMGWVITNKLLARKRPQLIPVYDGVVHCAFGKPTGLWNWLLAMFATGELEQLLMSVRAAAGVAETVSPLRVLDVIVWMHHRHPHRKGDCARAAQAATGPSMAG